MLLKSIKKIYNSNLKLTVNKAEHDKISHDVAKVQGDVVSIKKDLSQIEIVTANNWADIAKLKAVQ